MSKSTMVLWKILVVEPLNDSLTSMTERLFVEVSDGTGGRVIEVIDGPSEALEVRHGAVEELEIHDGARGDLLIDCTRRSGYQDPR